MIGSLGEESDGGMTTMGIEIALAIGVLMLGVGAVAKNKWLMLVSMLPLAIAGVQLVLLFGM